MAGVRNKVVDTTTADASADSNTIKCIDYETKLIFIKNNHGSNGIQYQITAYADGRDTTDSAHILRTWTVITAGNTVIHKTMDPWDTIKISYKNQTGSSNASIVAWINMGGR